MTIVFFTILFLWREAMTKATLIEERIYLKACSQFQMICDLSTTTNELLCFTHIKFCNIFFRFLKMFINPYSYIQRYLYDPL